MEQFRAFLGERRWERSCPRGCAPQPPVRGEELGRLSKKTHKGKHKDRMPKTQTQSPADSKSGG